jgi:hypothetical protein
MRKTMSRILIIAVSSLIFPFSLLAQTSNSEQVSQLLKRMEDRASRFEKIMDRILDESKLNDTSKEDRVNQIFKEFRSEVSQLYKRFDDNKYLLTNVKTVLSYASQINEFMQRNWSGKPIQRDWLLLKSDLNQLARFYNIRWQWKGDQQLYTGVVQRRVNRQEASLLIDRIASQAASFRDRLDKSLDKSLMDGTRDEDNINEVVKEFEFATSELQRRFESDQPVAADVETVLATAARIDVFMQRNLLRSKGQTDWKFLKDNLNKLARIYNVAWNWSDKTYTPTALRNDIPKKGRTNGKRS